MIGKEPIKMKKKVWVVMLMFALAATGCSKQEKTEDTGNIVHETSDVAEEGAAIYGKVTQVSENSITIATGTYEARKGRTDSGIKIKGEEGIPPEIPENGGETPDGTPPAIPENGGKTPDGTPPAMSENGGETPDGTPPAMPNDGDKAAGGKSGFIEDGGSLTILLTEATTIEKQSGDTTETIAVSDITVDNLIKIEGEETAEGYEATTIVVINRAMGYPNGGKDAQAASGGSVGITD